MHSSLLFLLFSVTMAFPVQDPINGQNSEILDRTGGKRMVHFSKNGEIHAITWISKPFEVKRGILWNVNAVTGKILSGPFRHSFRIGPATFSFDGKMIATAGDDRKVNIWNADTGKLIVGSLQHDAFINSISFDSAGQRLLTATEDGKAYIWDVKTGKQLIEPIRNNWRLYHAMFSPDGKYVATAGNLDRACVWDAATGKQLVLVKHANVQEVNHVSFSPDGKYVVSSGSDRRALVWQTDNGKVLLTLDHEGPVYFAVFSTNGKRIATTSRDGKTRVWQIPTGKLEATFDHGRGWTWMTNFDAAGNQVLTTTENNEKVQVTVGDIQNGKVIAQFKEDFACRNAFISPDGQRVVLIPNQGKAVVYDIASKKRLSPMEN